MTRSNAGSPRDEDGAASGRAGGLLLVVVQGDSVGARFAIGEREQIIGRGANADVRLRDPRISRQHAWVSLAPGGLRLRCCPQASPLLIDEVETPEGVAAIDHRIVIGETVLTVVAPTSQSEATDIRTLLTGPAADVRGLSGVFALAEALDATRTAPTSRRPSSRGRGATRMPPRSPFRVGGRRRTR